MPFFFLHSWKPKTYRCQDNSQKSFQQGGSCCPEGPEQQQGVIIFDLCGVCLNANLLTILEEFCWTADKLQLSISATMRRTSVSLPELEPEAKENPKSTPHDNTHLTRPQNFFEALALSCRQTAHPNFHSTRSPMSSSVMGPSHRLHAQIACNETDKINALSSFQKSGCGNHPLLFSHPTIH